MQAVCPDEREPDRACLHPTSPAKRGGRSPELSLNHIKDQYRVFENQFIIKSYYPDILTV